MDPSSTTASVPAPPAGASGPVRLRSVLYVPGANQRALDKAPALEADAYILDLEDAVTPAAKADARHRTRASLDSGAFAGRTVTIRVNAIGTEWHEDDIRAAAAAEPSAIVLPKISSPADVIDADRALTAVGASEHTALWAMLETPAAVQAAAAIATASPRLTVLVMGTNDLLNELYASPTPDRGPLLAALSTCVLAARATGRLILDGVYNDVRDADGFAAECGQGRAYGFDGKTLIHPGQVGPCNQAFSPSAEEVEHARRVIDAFQQAERAGSGVATLDGKMIENLHVAGARRVLQLAD